MLYAGHTSQEEPARLVSVQLTRKVRYIDVQYRLTAVQQ